MPKFKVGDIVYFYLWDTINAGRVIDYVWREEDVQTETGTVHVQGMYRVKVLNGGVVGGFDFMLFATREECEKAVMEANTARFTNYKSGITTLEDLVEFMIEHNCSGDGDCIARKAALTAARELGLHVSDPNS